MNRLTYKRRKFIEEYLTCWNATEAARRAGYACPNVEGPKNLVIPSIAAEIKRRIAEVAMGADEALIRLAEHARGEWTQYITENGELDIARMVHDDRAHLIQEIRPTKSGTVYKFPDSQNAIIQICKGLGIFRDNLDITSGGEPIMFEVKGIDLANDI